ncbi:MAG: hypothetical protein ACHREM_09515 [Polyangiales bacterium]
MVFSIADAVFETGSQQAAGSFVSVLKVVASDVPSVCANAKAGNDFGDAHVLVLEVDRTESSASIPVAVGTYTFGSLAANYAMYVEWGHSPPDCGAFDKSYLGTAGSITFTEADSERTTGTFAVTLDNGLQISGTFDTAACFVPDAPSTTACLPGPGSGDAATD